MGTSTRSVATESKKTYRPSGDTAGEPLELFAGWPAAFAEMSVVLFAWVSRRNTWLLAFVTPKLTAEDTNATQRPSGEIDGEDPLAWALVDVSERRGVDAATAAVAAGARP